MNVDTLFALVVVFLAIMSCVKWMHAYAHERKPSHLATIFIRVFFAAMYIWILVMDVHADQARVFVRILISLLFFDEIVNWLGTFIFKYIARRKRE